MLSTHRTAHKYRGESQKSFELRDDSPATLASLTSGHSFLTLLAFGPPNRLREISAWGEVSMDRQAYPAGATRNAV